MEKTLKLGARPFIVLAICLSPVAAAAVYGIGSNLLKGNLKEAMGIAAVVGLLGAFILSQLRFTKIRVTDEKIAICGWFGEKQSVFFRDVSYTKVNILFERDWPVSIDIYTADQKRPALVIRLKLLRKADVAWLVSLSALKVRD